jgi:hypothetical protein
METHPFLDTLEITLLGPSLTICSPLSIGSLFSHSLCLLTAILFWPWKYSTTCTTDWNANYHRYTTLHSFATHVSLRTQYTVHTRRRGAGTGFSPSISIFPTNYYSTIVPYSFSIYTTLHKLSNWQNHYIK